MSRRSFFIFVLCGAILISLVLLLMINVPVSYEIYEISLDTIYIPESNGAAADLEHIGTLTTQKIRVEVPERILLGNRAPFRVFFLPKDEDFGLKESFIRSDSYRTADISTAHGFEKHNIFLEARLEMAYAGVNPQGILRETYHSEYHNSFYWFIEPEMAGQFNGILWVYYIETDGAENIQERTAILARPVQLECMSIFKLKTRDIFWVSLVVLSINFVLGFFIVIRKRASNYKGVIK